MSDSLPVRSQVFWKRRTENIKSWHAGPSRILNYGQDEDTGTAGTQNLLYVEGIPHDPAEEIVDFVSVDIDGKGNSPAIDLVMMPFSVSLSGAIGTGDTSISTTALGKAADWPNQAFFKFAGSDEICQITAGGGTTSWTIRRGEHGTTAESHSNNDAIYRLIFTVDHEQITLGKDGTALDPPTLSLTSLLNGFELGFAAPSDAGRRLRGYEVYKGTSTAPTTLFTFVEASTGAAQTVHVELDSGETVTDTFYFRAKSKTNAGVLSATFSNEVSGTAAQLDTNLLKANAQKFITDIVFSATDNDTVQWTSGTIKLADGTTYAINSGNTGNMTALTLIYFDSAVSTTDLQTTVNFLATITETSVWLAYAEDTAATAQDAFFVPLVGVFGINESQIGDNSISTAKIQALAVTAAEIAANTITSSQITTAALTGLIIQTTASGVIRTAAAGARVEMASNKLSVYDSSSVERIKLYITGGDDPQLLMKAGTAGLGSDGELPTGAGSIIFGTGGFIAADSSNNFHISTGDVVDAGATPVELRLLAAETYITSRHDNSSAGYKDTVIEIVATTTHTYPSAPVGPMTAGLKAYTGTSAFNGFGDPYITLFADHPSEHKVELTLYGGEGSGVGGSVVIEHDDGVLFQQWSDVADNTPQAKFYASHTLHIPLGVVAPTSTSAACQQWLYDDVSGGELQYAVLIAQNTESVFGLSNVDLTTGASVTGPQLRVGRNSNATPAAGSIRLTDKSGTNYYLWVDDSGVLRINTSAPLNGTDTGGTVVGSQT